MSSVCATTHTTFSPPLHAHCLNAQDGQEAAQGSGAAPPSSAAPGKAKKGGAGGKAGGGGVAAGAAGVSCVTLDVEWVTEHARQVARMLPGGEWC